MTTPTGKSKYAAIGKGAIAFVLLSALVVVGLHVHLSAQVSDEQLTKYLISLIFGAVGAIIRLLDDLSAEKFTSLHDKGAWISVIFQMLFGSVMASVAYLGLIEGWLLKALVTELPSNASSTTGGAVIIGLTSGIIAPSKLVARLADK